MALVKKGIKQLIAEAEARSKSISVEDSKKRVGDPGTLFVDLRDVRELERDGMIPGAFHAPRGMLEFWVDPDSPYYKPVFAEGKTFILYCQADWRGTLAAATLADMGVQNVLHMEGGFGEWKKAGGPTAERSHKTSA
ncbi:MAG: rhodanese-like domain-containing protein [Proteobacteria bacterium]|nr:rhodanese-like domain-containing protein [Pseudomonadota bacterium]MDA0982435.1 rhodanese-like domain-containing protein [Pseudomonadota bacterium]